MKPTGSSSNWADQANDLAASTEALSIAAKGSANDFGSEAQQEIKYALQWGERVAITDDLIAQICPADLAGAVCEFDYVMPNGCDNNCQMLRICSVYVKNYKYECPNTETDEKLCPYVHDLKLSCSNVNNQHDFHLREGAKAKEQSSGWSVKVEPTAAELKRRERKERKSKGGNKDAFICSKALVDDCAKGHDHQAARLASYALLEKHLHAGRVRQGKETETFEEKRKREEEERNATQPKKANAGATDVGSSPSPLPADATSTLVATHLSYDTTEEGLQAACKENGSGAVKRVKILTDDVGKSKGIGFIDFNNAEDATAILNAMQDFNLDGRTMTLKYKEPRPGGGGGGGGSRACFSCGEEGHMSRDCPTKSGGGGSRACFSCGEEGHMSRDCPTKNGGSGGSGFGAGDSTVVVKSKLSETGGATLKLATPHLNNRVGVDGTTHKRQTLELSI